MIREKAKQWYMVLSLRGPDVNEFDVAHQVIDNICDEYESMICSNCSHGMKYKDKKYKECSIWRHIRKNSYGCNDFNRKENK